MNRCRRRKVSLGLAGAWFAAAISPAHADDNRGYRTRKLVASDQNECAGVPACISRTSPAVSVPGLRRVSQRFTCPDDHPNLWGWDAAQHEHISVRRVAIDQTSVTVEGANAIDNPGDFVVSLGCSSESYTGSVVQSSRQLAPTQRLPRRRPPRPAYQAKAKLILEGIIRGVRDKDDEDDDDDGETATDGDACSGVPSCQLQPQPSFAMGGWASTTKSYQCQSPYPFAWSFSYTQTGSPSVSAIGAIFAENPGTYDVLLTNWNPFATDTVDITVACSKNNSFGGDCGAPQDDPSCPVVEGSEKNYCSSGPVPVCFQTYQERCANNQLYSCTIDLGVAWCQPCPG